MQKERNTAVKVSAVGYGREQVSTELDSKEHSYHCSIRFLRETSSKFIISTMPIYLSQLSQPHYLRWYCTLRVYMSTDTFPQLLPPPTPIPGSLMCKLTLLCLDFAHLTFTDGLVWKMSIDFTNFIYTKRPSKPKNNDNPSRVQFLNFLRSHCQKQRNITKHLYALSLLNFVRVPVVACFILA